MSHQTKASGAEQKSGLNIPGFAQLQRLGKSLMLPIAVLPAAGILLRLGQDDLLGKIKAPVIGPFFQAMSAAGGALFDNSRTLSRLIGHPTTPLSASVSAALSRS